jgi:hypothetical protein
MMIIWDLSQQMHNIYFSNISPTKNYVFYVRQSSLSKGNKEYL